MSTNRPFSVLRLLATLTTLTALLIAPVPQANASRLGAQVNANVLFNLLRSQGWTVRESFSWGLLERGDSVVIPTTLYAGNTYKLVAAGCEDAFDVDIAVFDENANLIDRDNDTSRVAVADFSPRWSGTFYIKVTMYNSTANGAHYVVQYAFHK